MICSEISVAIADNFAKNEFRKYYRSIELVESFEKAYVIYDDNYNILGTVIFSVFANEANINSLIVRDINQHEGIGTALLNIVENYCRINKIKFISLSTYRFEAPRFYEKWGFELTGVAVNKSDSKLDKLYYMKELGGYCADVFAAI